MQINKTSFYLNDKQIAARYNVHRTTVWRWVRAGLFPQPRRISGSTRWADDDIATHEARLAGRGREV